MKSTTLLAAAVVGSIGASAVAGPTFIVTKGTTMFRADDNGTEIFTLSDSLHSLTIDKNGAYIGGTGTPDGNYELYELTGPYTKSPALAQVGTTMQRAPTLANINGTLYGFMVDPGDLDADLLFSLDDGFNTNLIGNLGVGNGIGGSAYDPVNDKYYVADHIANVIYDVDYTNATINNTINVPLDFEFHGGEWYEGQFWTALVDLDANNLVVGTFDLDNGTFSEQFIVFEGVSELEGTVSFVVVPAPGAVGLLGLGLAAGVIRRRR